MTDTLITGASGFLGNYIREVFPQSQTLGRNQNSNIVADLASQLDQKLKFSNVVHCAGLAHVQAAGNEDLFNNINYEGTKNLIDALDRSQIKAIVFISTVATYGIDQGTNINENAYVLARDPYGRSKILAERYVKEFCESNSTPYLILRLPLIAGKNPPGNLGAMINGIKSGKYFRIGNGSTRRSVVLAEDVAILIKKWMNSELKPSGIYNLTDSYDPSFFELEEQIRIHFSKSKIWSLPIFAARMIAKIGDVLPKFPLTTMRLSKITNTLTFDCSKAMNELEWKPKKVIESSWM
ncbi:NAD-dependent epimerase/dehydratase family protein [bacterium]|nr:NAD-dependent epimerase/dehydratase family protein [bacterium]